MGILMDKNQLYKDLSEKVGLGNSEHLHDVWRLLCTDDEAIVANMLPGTVAEIAEKAGKTPKETENILLSLFKKGAAFRSDRGDGMRYKLAKNIVQFHDASLLWDGATDEFYDAWKKVMDEEFSGFLKSMPDSFQMPSFMRVIPINEAIEARNEVLTFEECEKMLHGSEKIAVVKCPCRLSQKNCDSPVETCIQINMGAEYVIDRGHGRTITMEEALDIIREARDAGLVQMTENRSTGNAICNCCSCCCEMFRLIVHSGKKWILSPSRYQAKVSDDCTACAACIDICPVEAVSVDEKAEINADLCMGCGLCATVCPEDVITLEVVRPEGHIPG
jgi:Pyruvate/2-oxoacid:ferredoxin oxidoreductase delta subunit